VGVLHRDIKPGNLLLTRTNQVKVTDFGLAKTQGDVNLTSEGQFVGTVAYSSPEQLRGTGEVSKASDVYSFGAVMYQMLTGQQPFRGSNPAELYYAVHETEPRPIRDANPDVDVAMTEVVSRCLRKQPNDRYADFVELERAITAIELARNAHARACRTCGMLSGRSLTKCSVCGTTLRRTTQRAVKSATKAAPALWRCDCGSDVSGEQSTCAKCGRARPGESKTCLSPWNLDTDKEYLVELKSNGIFSPWLLDRSGYTLGRAQNMKIRIDDSSIAQFQLFLVRLPCGWLAMNPQLNPQVAFNGWPQRQHVLRPGDLLHLGATWLAFAGPGGMAEPLTLIPGRWPERAIPLGKTIRTGGSLTLFEAPSSPTACTLECTGGQKYCTRGQPLRIGSSPLCEVRLNDATVAPFQALLTWRTDGPHLISVSGAAVRKIAGDTITDSLLHDGDLLQIGSFPIRTRVEGDLSEPGRRWAEATSSPGRFAMTVLTGPQRGQTAVIPAGQSLSVGRHSDCDIVIASDSFVSRRHAEITASASEIDVKDLGSRGGFFLNQAHFTNTAVARLGDVVVLGKTSLLVHHEVDAE
jgi:pSer/pThr/pTyr-binding forkhead associated (FHA) protein